MYYRGRDMVLIHRGMRISESDWNVFLGHAAATLAKFQVPEAEQRDVVAFVQKSQERDRRITCSLSSDRMARNFQHQTKLRMLPRRAWS